VRHLWTAVEGSVLVLAVAPLLLMAVLALATLGPRPLGERTVGLLTRVGLLAALFAAVSALVGHIASGSGPRVLRFGAWYSFGQDSFSFDFAIDGMSLGFAVLVLGICNIVAVFSFRYLHLERGFHRYFVQLAMFVSGMTLVGLAGSIEVLFVGWEFLGLSSVLLIGFFHERPGPVRNALRVFAVYRASDAAMLSAAVLLHHWAGTGSLSLLFSETSMSGVDLDSSQALIIAILVIIAVAAKSALWPFSGWLPRAMEGPTPSSAVYYGSLSVHAGCFLLIRAEPLLAQSDVARFLALLAGATTTIYASVTARVQTDVKSSLSFATLTQVGIIVVETSLGFTTLAFIHIIGHACFRLLQFLSAPNILDDLHELEDRLGGHLEHGNVPALAPTFRRSLYLLALERGFADASLDRLLVQPFGWLVERLDALDRRLAGSPSPSRGEVR
jgi:NADH-quinone oxidoreductase subunit L